MSVTCLNLDAVKYKERKLEKVVVVLPAYNAENTLEATVKDIPGDLEIILVDDCSKDKTVEVAKKLGVIVEVHKVNKGYGANLKTCFRLAKEMNADVVVVLHPDYQYDGRLIPSFVGFLRLGVCDVLLGSRVRTRKETLAGGMPVWKYLFNRLLTFIENVALGQNLGDAHSGFRCFTREVLDTIPYEKNSNDFSFDTEVLAQAAYFGFKLGDAPMPVRYFDGASSISFVRCIKYTYETLLVVVKFLLARWGIYKDKVFRERVT